MKQQARAPRRSRADDLRELPAREPAAQSCVQGGKAGRRRGELVVRIERRQRGRERPIELFGAEERFEVGACDQSHVSLYFRLTRRTIAQAPDRDQAASRGKIAAVLLQA